VPICSDCKKKSSGLFPKVKSPASFDEQGKLKFRNKSYEEKWMTLNSNPPMLKPLPRKLFKMWITLWFVNLFNLAGALYLGSASVLLFEILLVIGTFGAQMKKKWGIYVFGGSVILGTLLSFFGVLFGGFWGLVHSGINKLVVVLRSGKTAKEKRDAHTKSTRGEAV
jgi:hypothetical protein